MENPSCPWCQNGEHVIISLTTGAFQLRQARRQHHQRFERSLFEARLAAYPQLYSYLSAYGKRILYGRHGRDSLEKFRESVDTWNNEYGFLFAPSTSSLSWRFRHYLKAVLDDEPTAGIHNRQWITIRRTIGAFERSLRTEIGIYDTSPVGEAPDLLANAQQVLDEELAERRVAND